MKEIKRFDRAGFFIIFKYKTNRYTTITGIEILSSSTGRKISSFQIFAVVDCGSRSKLGHNIFNFTVFSLSAEELVNPFTALIRQM